ncbi:MAG: GntR family transcriptional regulator, partial [Thermomicrobiales bacterium]
MHPIRSLLSQDGSSLAVSREPLSSEVAERLRVLIRNGELPPGTRLVETALADLLKVSRGPVREALRALDREGLVVISPHKGAVVAEWSLQDLLDVYDVRDLLEIRAMELATERASADCAAELDDLLMSWQEAAASGDRERCADLDFDFHRAIWRHTHNRCLI